MSSRNRWMPTDVFSARNRRSSADVNSDSSGIGQISPALLFASRLMIGRPLPDPENDEFRRAEQSHPNQHDEPAVVDVVLSHGRTIAADEEGLLGFVADEPAPLKLHEQESLNLAADPFPEKLPVRLEDHPFRGRVQRSLQIGEVTSDADILPLVVGTHWTGWKLGRIRDCKRAG